MSEIFPGRYTAEIDSSFVVFLIGLRVNQFWNFRKWFWVANAMPPMLKILAENPEKGLLGWESYYRFSPLSSIIVSYWRSFEDLERFARDPAQPHAPAWHRFNQEIGASDSVGIWHETYLVQAGQYETIYGNMPQYGLAAATKHISLSERTNSARGRIKA
jgi:Domain of unknown function (DUF4188)